jgi:glutamate-1-semialdehyde 2,1-aminomutase
LFHRYHAPLDELGDRDFGEAIPGAAGMDGAPRHALVVRFNQAEVLERCLEAHRGQVAAILLEPVMGNAGVIPPVPGFLERVRALATAHGAVLIFDEVITGLRVAPGGAQQLYGVRPDLTVVSKAIGAGFPVAAFGGGRDIMQLLADGRAFHGGVYAANAMAMAAVEATLDELATLGDAFPAALREAGDVLAAGLADVLGRHGVPHVIQHVGAMVGVCLTDGTIAEVREYRDIRRHGDFDRYVRLQHQAQARGVYFHPNMFEPLMLSTAHRRADLGVALERIEAAVTEVVRAG